MKKKNPSRFNQNRTYMFYAKGRWYHGPQFEEIVLVRYQGRIARGDHGQKWITESMSLLPKRDGNYFSTRKELWNSVGWLTASDNFWNDSGPGSMCTFLGSWRTDESRG